MPETAPTTTPTCAPTADRAPLPGKLKVGLLLDSMTLAAWEYEMVREIAASDYAQIDLVVLRGGATGKAGPPPARGSAQWRGRLYGLYTRLEYHRTAIEPDAGAARDGHDLLANYPVLVIPPASGPGADPLGDSDLEAIKSYQLDVLIRLGVGAVAGGILAAARFGVWAYHQGDNQYNGAGPPAFWEVFTNNEVIGSSLLMLTEARPGGRVLFGSQASTNTLSVRQSCNSNYWKMLSFVPRKLKELHDLGESGFRRKLADTDCHPQFYSGPLHAMPRAGQLLTMAARLAVRYFKQKVRETFWFTQWVLMFDLQDGISGAPARFTRMAPPRGRSWADPQIVRKGGLYYIFLEEFIHSTSRGHLSVLTIDEQGRWTDPVPIIREPHHMSYPFVFEWQGRYYLIPETRATRTISLYECVEFPFKWEFRRHVMEDVSARDSTLFFDGQRWWLFATMAEHDGAPASDDLFLFYADDPVNGPWQPHPANPVVSDARRSRPAGRLFRHNGNLYRPSQDCARDYGFAVNINHVTALSPTEYREEVVGNILPSWDRKITGVHTFQHDGRLTIIDARIVRRRIL